MQQNTITTPTTVDHKLEVVGIKKICSEFTHLHIPSMCYLIIVIRHNLRHSKARPVLTSLLPLVGPQF